MPKIVGGLSVVLVLITTLSANSARAIAIEQFDKMTDADQDEYVAELVLGAQKALKDEGRPDLAEQVHRLFTEKDPEAKVSTGMIQFDLSLAKARVTDLERRGKDPKATPLEVEHAMIVVFKKNGISVPKGFMSVMKDFKPKDPLK